MVLGVYYLTMKHQAAHIGDGRAFADMDEVELAYQLDQLDVHSEIKLLATTWYNDNGDRRAEPEKRIINTTVGRVLMYEICPREIPFSAVNKVMGKKQLADLIDLVYRLCGQKTTVPFKPTGARPVYCRDCFRAQPNRY